MYNSEEKFDDIFVTEKFVLDSTFGKVIVMSSREGGYDYKIINRYGNYILKLHSNRKSIKVTFDENKIIVNRQLRDSTRNFSIIDEYTHEGKHLRSTHPLRLNMEVIQ